ncbi:diacylglycerol kinase, partial [Brevibacterium paucivorans]
NVLVTTPKNIAQWASVLLAVVGRRKRGLATEIVTCSSVTIEAEEELALQLDGDFAGMSDYFEMRVVHALACSA